MHAIHRLTCGLVLAAISAAVAGESAAPEAEKVTFTTSDGVEIVGDYYAPEGKKKAPCAICVHMYPAERSSWKPLVPDLRARGFAVLAYDIRGAGESLLPKEKALNRLYGDRDTKLFGDAWKDAEAAAKFLAGRKECDASRIVMIGASVGCSISLDFASRDPNVVAVVCLSPGKDYMGINSTKHIAKLGKRPVLLISPEAEKASSQGLAKRHKESTVEIKPGGEDRHGTRMFDADYGPALMKQIATFAADSVAAAPEGETKPAKKAQKKPKA